MEWRMERGPLGAERRWYSEPGGARWEGRGVRYWLGKPNED